MIHKHVLVTGRVQGVYYRDTCRRVATDNDVTGWVRNLPDGRVEAVFEGTPANVDALLDWARTGPPDAHVTAVTTSDGPVEDLATFEIR